MENITKNFSVDSIEQIENQLTIWTVAELVETTDHLGESIIEVLEAEGVEIPKGYFSKNFSIEVVNLAKDLESKKVSLKQAVISIVAILIDPNNYWVKN
jgi:hypothetical protein